VVALADAPVQSAAPSALFSDSGSGAAASVLPPCDLNLDAT